MFFRPTLETLEGRDLPGVLTWPVVRFEHVHYQAPPEPQTPAQALRQALTDLETNWAARLTLEDDSVRLCRAYARRVASDPVALATAREALRQVEGGRDVLRQSLKELRRALDNYDVPLAESASDLQRLWTGKAARELDARRVVEEQYRQTPRPELYDQLAEIRGRLQTHRTCLVELARHVEKAQKRSMP